MTTNVRVAFETARLRLSELLAEGQQARENAYRAACEHSARTLDVERVSIWFFNEGGDTLTRALQYTGSTGTLQRGGQIVRQSCERYFDALMSRRVVAACDAARDPRTEQLLPYLKQEGVTALLDAPICRDGRVIGVVCHEHVGGVREWTEREAGFASAVADLLTMLIHQAERSELRAALDAQREATAQHQKMQALVRMARVVVHDLSNVMMVATARAGEIADESNPREGSREVVEVLEYGGKLLRQLRMFCDEGGPGALSQVEAVGLLRGMEASLRSLLGKAVTLRLESQVPEATISMPPMELEQLVLNLCMNARDATSQRESGEVRIALSRHLEGILIEIADNGCGMDEATQTEIFEPFYTTKPGHSGVGLAAVYGIVERAHGRIALNSAPGRGTSFRITLPVLGPPRSAEPPWAF